MAPSTPLPLPEPEPLPLPDVSEPLPVPPEVPFVVGFAAEDEARTVAQTWCIKAAALSNEASIAPIAGRSAGSHARTETSGDRHANGMWVKCAYNEGVVERHNTNFPHFSSKRRSDEIIARLPTQLF